MKTAVILFFLALQAAPAAAQAPLTCDLVPGWQQSGNNREYSADNLFEYMDGNAEGYLLYGFVRMHGITCKSGANTLVIDISEMEDSDLAYGIFAANVDPNLPTTKMGMSGQIQPRRASFAKGKYYVEIAASPDVDQTTWLRAFIMKIEERLDGQPGHRVPLRAPALVEQIHPRARRRVRRPARRCATALGRARTAGQFA